MASITDKGSIVVDQESVASDDSDDDIVQSNIDFINRLFPQYYEIDDLSQDALRSYEVDYYLAQMLNGGFAQFVKNSNWTSATVRLVREGLLAIGARRHLELFDEGVALAESLGDAGLKRFMATTIQNYAASAERAILEAPDNRFYELDTLENLRTLNCAWLRHHPDLVPASSEQIDAEIERRAKLVADRA